MITPGTLPDDHPLGRFAPAEEDARQVHVHHGLPLVEAHLRLDLAVLVLDEQRIPRDARVVHERVDRAALRHDLVEEGDDVGFLRHVGAEAVDGGAQLLAGGRRGLEVVGLEVDQREHRACAVPGASPWRRRGPGQRR